MFKLTIKSSLVFALVLSCGVASGMEEEIDPEKISEARRKEIKTQIDTAFTGPQKSEHEKTIHGLVKNIGCSFYSMREKQAVLQSRNEWFRIGCGAGILSGIGLLTGWFAGWSRQYCLSTLAVGCVSGILATIWNKRRVNLASQQEKTAINDFDASLNLVIGRGQAVKENDCLAIKENDLRFLNGLTGRQMPTTALHKKTMDRTSSRFPKI